MFSPLRIVLLLACVAIHPVLSFKENEFKKCAQTSFCSRNRNVEQGKNFEIPPATVQLNVATLTATLVNTQYSKHLQLTLTSHADGFLRVMVDESPSVGRYQVPGDILVSGWENKKLGFQETSRSASSISASAGNTTVELSFKPFALSISVKGVPALQLNSRNLFNFEHRRAKQDTDPAGYWEETWMGHTDSKPKGPEAMSLDLVFPGFQHVYGIPERATSLSLRATDGVAPYSEPYRLYNLDVFEYLEDHPFGLYGSIPFMMAHKKGLTRQGGNGRRLNAAEMFVDLTKGRGEVGTQWIAESGIVDLFVFTGGSAPAVLASYARVAGTTALPQLFSLGYHQCRWNYKDEADVKAVDAGFDGHEIPYDVLWLDIEHTNGKRCVSVPMLLTLGLTGLPYSGADVGGFFGNPDSELMTRWYQVGIFYPFFRGHAHLETQRREPWLFGPEPTARIRTAIRERYALLPYIYTLFRAANTSGLPILRPLWYEFPESEELFAVEEEFMVGSGMLVKPVVAPGVSLVDVTLPVAARWYDALTGVAVPPRTRTHRVQAQPHGTALQHGTALHGAGE
ncbi:Neutral alpha-glucosidase AB [Tetrabaena socialis]|uniref:Glucosidase II subunit alpha n=1 Tax=Tetrabaena socialis TaxID=47790 RepID=A0A2J8AA32_9CHLO|nr:Neutral alpha-glucosidase AB [Tetrabaena socialis]|eukprot:PNH09384.1 Neutral alpha-glucosidase AB [Tetrabaena socialis]